MSDHTHHDELGHDHDHGHSQPEAKAPTHADAACCAPVAPKKSVVPEPLPAATACCGSSAAPAAQTVAPIGKPVVGTDGVQTPIRILQMDCPTEEGLLRKKLGGMAGVTALEFNLMQRVLTVT
ncbi:MAG: hypothetical protein RIR09_80, partial [Pseudomonadota bacterium]